MNKELVLLRGLPGSGKSTIAKSLGIKHLEADMFFIENGEYKFNPSKIKNAHAWCQAECEHLMKWEFNIVVSNTFTQEWEMMPYIELAKKYGYKVHTIIVENRHGGKNTHNVPTETIEKMRNRFA